MQVARYQGASSQFLNSLQEKLMLNRYLTLNLDEQASRPGLKYPRRDSIMKIQRFLARKTSGCAPFPGFGAPCRRSAIFFQQAAPVI